MADNYLEKKMEEWREKPAASTKKSNRNLLTLLRKNRSYRGYEPSFEVRRDQLLKIIEVNRLIPSARNRQALRFRPVLKGEAQKVLPHIKLGGALPHLHLPFPGTEPEAFIVIGIEPEDVDDKFLYVDLGISAQSMLLRAAELGLGGIIIGAFNPDELTRSLNLKLKPLLVVAVGRPAERIELVDIHASESHAYYREEGVHYVPKVLLEELIVE